ncbi:MAG: carbohydrate kinase family protein [Candidatus Bipolaricaulota bacterium]
MTRILVLGDLNLDVHVDDRTIAAGHEVRAAVRVAPGGSAATFARIAAQLGAKVTFFGAVGDDLLGELLERSLDKAGVVPRLARSQLPSGAVVALRRGAERSMICARGANDALSTADLDAADFSGAQLLHVSGYAFLSPSPSAAAQRAIALARAAGARVSVDPPPANLIEAFGLDAMRRLLASADWLFPNESEGRAITGEGRAAQMADALAVRHAHGAVKLGPRGALAWRGEERYRSSPMDPLDVDPTGAGDAFAAGFAVATLAGATLAEATERATSSARDHLAARLST